MMLQDEMDNEEQQGGDIDFLSWFAVCPSVKAWLERIFVVGKDIPGNAKPADIIRKIERHSLTRTWSRVLLYGGTGEPYLIMPQKYDSDGGNQPTEEFRAWVQQQKDRMKETTEHFKTHVSGYYMNLSLVGALLGGFTLATLVASHNASIIRYGLDVSSTYQTSLGITGGGALTLLIWCVADCITIDATVRKLRNGKQALTLLQRYPIFLGNPNKLLFGGIVLYAICLNLFVGLQYSITASHVLMVVMAVMALVVLRNVRLQSQFLNKLAKEEAYDVHLGEGGQTLKEKLKNRVREELVSIVWTGAWCDSDGGMDAPADDASPSFDDRAEAEASLPPSANLPVPERSNKRVMVAPAAEASDADPSLKA